MLLKLLHDHPFFSNLILLPFPQKHRLLKFVAYLAYFQSKDSKWDF